MDGVEEQYILSLASAVFLWVQSLHQTSSVDKEMNGILRVGPHSNCDHVFFTALSNNQNRHVENWVDFASIFLGMFPRLQTEQRLTGAVINSPSVSVWMPESQLKET